MNLIIQRLKMFHISAALLFIAIAATGQHELKVTLKCEPNWETTPFAAFSILKLPSSKNTSETCCNFKRGLKFKLKINRNLKVEMKVDFPLKWSFTISHSSNQNSIYTTPIEGEKTISILPFCLSVNYSFQSENRYVGILFGKEKFVSGIKTQVSRY